MRDRDNGSTLAGSIQRRLNAPFGQAVQRGGRFVQDQHRRILQQHPRDGQALTLSAAEPNAAVADHRVVAVRQRGREIVKLGAPHGLDQRRLVRVRRGDQ